jgi:hypothetical protein
MRINSRKIQKILERVWTTPKRIFWNLLHSRNTKMHRHECNTHSIIYLISEKQTKVFLYYIPCKENKCWKSFKIIRKLLFNYSLYSHPEIGNFRVWQRAAEVLAWGRGGVDRRRRRGLATSGANRPAADSMGLPWGRGWQWFEIEIRVTVRRERGRVAAA